MKNIMENKKNQKFRHNNIKNPFHMSRSNKKRNISYHTQILHVQKQFITMMKYNH